MQKENIDDAGQPAPDQPGPGSKRSTRRIPADAAADRRPLARFARYRNPDDANLAGRLMASNLLTASAPPEPPIEPIPGEPELPPPPPDPVLR